MTLDNGWKLKAERRAGVMVAVFGGFQGGVRDTNRSDSLDGL